MSDDHIYEERLSSSKTEVLFVGLTALFLILFIWQLSTYSSSLLSSVLLIFSIFFFFCSVNYR
ncbi:MAG: hypothetical protein ACERKX_13670, partial [Anaerolineales bacterium]